LRRVAGTHSSGGSAVADGEAVTNELLQHFAEPPIVSLAAKRKTGMHCELSSPIHQMVNPGTMRCHGNHPGGLDKNLRHWWKDCRVEIRGQAMFVLGAADAPDQETVCRLMSPALERNPARKNNPARVTL
jgi:hypothetical protein